MTLANQDHESAKERALRIPLDYVHGLDKVQKWKLTLSVVAALVTAGYAAWVVMSTNGAMAFSHGPVAQVHAAWEANCSACHLNYVAIRDDAANPLVRFGLFPSQQDPLAAASMHRRVDKQCQTCHFGAPHHDNEIAADARTCASCHTDHRGWDADIARPADAHCTRCHENVAMHRSSDIPSITSPAIADVSKFHTSAPTTAQEPHPDFRSLASDPGNVKFHHHMHMTAGIPAPDRKGQGKKLLTLADLPPEFVEQYRHPNQPRGVQNDREYLVQLDCASCHRLDVTNNRLAATGNIKAPSSGAYMLPVSFENNCRACHHLNYEPAAGKEVKHDLKPEEVREFLLGRYVYDAKSGKLAESATRLVPRRPIPGRSPEEFSSPGIPADVDAKVAAAERFLRETNACAKCHLFKTPDASATDFALPDVQPANIPQVWLRHARFDHAAHRAMACVECHAQAFPSQSSVDRPARSPDQDVVMIAGRDVCLTCHSPSSASGSPSRARFDCVECHRYHGADAPPHGIISSRLDERLP